VIKKLLLIIFATTILTACTDFTAEQTTDAVTGEMPDQESWDAVMYFTKDGSRRAVLHAGYVAKYLKKNTTYLKEKVKVDFFDEFGEHKSVLTSEEAQVFDRQNDMIATGNVIVVSDNGTRLYTEELIWNNREQKIISKTDVMITTDSDTLYGDSFRSDPDLANYEITNAHGSSGKTIKTDDE
jgi:LPS export ABC transporter protein LptC